MPVWWFPACSHDPGRRAAIAGMRRGLDDRTAHSLLTSAAGARRSSPPRPAGNVFDGRGLDHLAPGVRHSVREQTAAARGEDDLAREPQHIKRVFRPERDTLAHGAFGTWDREAWVRSLSKERFVLVDDFSLIHDRAYYAYAVALEAVMNLHGQVPSDARPVRPPEPHNQVPRAWDAKS